MARNKSGARKGSVFSVASVVDAVASARDSFRSADEPLLIRVHVDPGCPREVALAIKAALVPNKPQVTVEVRGLSLYPGDASDCDLVLLLAAPDCSECVKLARGYARVGTACALVVESAVDIPSLGLPEEQQALVGCVAASSPEALLPKLACWMVSATEKGVAVAAALPFCRKAEVESLVTECALENAVIGAVGFVPGGDFTVMTANQAKMAFDIAGAYGMTVTFDRALEIAGVVAAGLGYRTLARTFAGFVPGFGWVLKAGIGYAGTVTTAKALENWLTRDERKKTGPVPAPVPADAVAQLPVKVGSPHKARAAKAAAPKAQAEKPEAIEYLTL